MSKYEHFLEQVNKILNMIFLKFSNIFEKNL